MLKRKIKYKSEEQLLKEVKREAWKVRLKAIGIVIFDTLFILSLICIILRILR